MTARRRLEEVASLHAEEAITVYVETSIDRDQIVDLIHQIMPVRIHVTPPEENRVWMELSDPRRIELVPGRGLRVRCRARMRVPLFGVLVRVVVPDVQLMLKPKVVSTGEHPRLSFLAEVESLEVRGLPSFAERTVARKLTEALQPSTSPLYWEFGQTLTSAFDLPSRLEPLDELAIQVERGETEITDERIRFRIWMEADVERGAPGPTEARGAEEKEGATPEPPPERGPEEAPRHH